MPDLPTNPSFIVAGTGPGTGKSTVSGHLHTALERRSLSVRCFYETEVLNIAEFQTFFGLFRAADPQMVTALQHAIDAYFADYVPDDSLFMSDSLLPFVRWLILGEVHKNQILAFCRWLNGRFESRAPMLIVLRCGVEVGLARASQERGADWVEQWRRRESTYPLYRNHPDTDRSEVFEREAPFFDVLNWKRLEYDTEERTTAGIVSSVLGQCFLPSETSDYALTIDNGEYAALDASAPIQRFRIVDEQVELMGASLSLVGRADGRARLERSNSTLTNDSNGLLFDSSRFGRQRYRKLP